MFKLCQGILNLSFWLEGISVEAMGGKERSHWKEAFNELMMTI